jgi:hypothetical protein
MNVEVTGKNQDMIERIKCEIKKKAGDVEVNGVICQCLELKRELLYMKSLVTEKNAVLEERRLWLVHLEEVNALIRDKIFNNITEKSTWPDVVGWH